MYKPNTRQLTHFVYIFERSYWPSHFIMTLIAFSHFCFCEYQIVSKRNPRLRCVAFATVRKRFCEFHPRYAFADMDTVKLFYEI